jgi:hypothetical protein
MKIGIDLHGVLDMNPEVSRVVLKALIDAGHEIFIISGPPLIEILNILTGLGLEAGIHYSDAYSIVGFLKEKNVKMWLDKKKTWWADDEDWWSAKANISYNLKLDIMVDDSIQYARYFDYIDTEFILFTSNHTTSEVYKLNNKE